MKDIVIDKLLLPADYNYYYKTTSVLLRIQIRRVKEYKCYFYRIKTSYIDLSYGT